ncbi:hypothetical protein [Ectobacillus ponti]|uniref:Uncharacterized protein n=1 Tax=Ectobacillus ponti TaxID=2961894 RepID=A0AA41XC68_9BACI|nr:hypothetical protein [Ectobacillus ponti]MCP8970745.1 hypothetical protein [Ectobacillus ponti]
MHVRVYQPKEEALQEVHRIIEEEGQNPTDELLGAQYTLVFETDEMNVPNAFADEDVLLDSVEAMVNLSQQKLRPLGRYDVIDLSHKGQRRQILMFEDGEYEVIEV